MISKQRYEIACHQYAESQAVMEAYFRERREEFERRIAVEGSIWLEEELVYSASRRCKCGAGMAYPDGCLAGWYWACSEVLKGVVKDGADPSKHTGPLFFIYCDVEKEGSGGTTRRCAEG